MNTPPEKDPVSTVTAATRPPAATVSDSAYSDPSGNSLFEPTAFGMAGLRPAGRVLDARVEVFDVCHVGVVLRTVLFTHAVLGVAALFNAGSLSSWLLQLALSAGIALPGILLWLTAACSLRRWLAPASRSVQWAAAGALGALSGTFGAWLGQFAGLEPAVRGAWFAPALAGAGLALVVTVWLQMRALARTPADTTARLAELQSRIRPHFLFNTLNTALSLVRLDPARAEGVLEDLAELFRVALTETGESVTLNEEVELARRYLAIEQIRFGSRMQLVWDLNPDAGKARVPPLLLQPLVENAVRHGVEPAVEGGVIRIRTRIKLGRVVISIANTVSGVPSRPGNGMALRNVRERLRLMHDVAADFDARQVGDAFRVELVVPL